MSEPKQQNDILKETFAFFYLQGELTTDELLYNYRLIDLHFPKKE